MSWGVLHGAMLLGLLGAAIPVLVHLLNRRWDPVVDWGAMQFLDPGTRARRRFRLAEQALMMLRIGVLAAVAVALARPFWTPSPALAGSGSQESRSSSAGRSDLVFVLDGSASMGRRLAGTSPWAQAITWAKKLVSRIEPGSSAAILLARDRVRPLVEPPTYDKAKLERALNTLPDPRGASDLPAALAEALRILEQTQQPARHVIVLSDGQRFPWRPGESARWALLRDLHRRLPVPSQIWVLSFGAAQPADGPQGSVGALELARSLVAPGQSISVTTQVANSGHGSLTCTAELLLDDQPVPGTAQQVGPIPAGGRMPIALRTVVAMPGSHLLTVRLTTGSNSLPGAEESSRPIEVASALPVVLVNGKPGAEPLRGSTDFLRAALAPAGDQTPQVRVRVVSSEALDAPVLAGQRVAVLANVERLTPQQARAVESFLESGGGVLAVLGDRTDAVYYNEQLYREGAGWLPARLGEAHGDPGQPDQAPHPAPRSFSGPWMAPFGSGESPALGDARVFAYRELIPSARPAAGSVLARLDTNDPWLVERAYGRGRAAVLAGSLDADGGTLPVNPDFLPWVYELIFHLADSGARANLVAPGEPILMELDPAPAADLKTLPVRTPGGKEGRAAVVRPGLRGTARVRIDDTSEAGVYRVALQDLPGGLAYAVVAANPRELDLAPLEQPEAAHLAEGWPLQFGADPSRLPSQLFARHGGGRHEFWRTLLLAALAGLALEVWLTRRLAQGRERVS